MLRKYMEEITGVLTGSDCDIKRRLNQDLLEMGLKAEGITNNKVWMVKSHYPERVGATLFNVNKCVLIVRNPLDAITSLFNMVATGTHNYSIAEHDYEKF